MAKSQEYAHLERLKALETGQPAMSAESDARPHGPREKLLHSTFWIAFWIGAGVPIAATWGASSVMIQTKLTEFRLILTIWICVAVVSVASVICATILMSRLSRGEKRDKICPEPVKEGG